MFAVAGGIILSLLIISLLIGFAVMIRSIARTIGPRGKTSNMSIVRRVPPGDARRWMGVVMVFSVLIGLGYVMNATTQHNVPVSCSREGDIKGKLAALVGQASRTSDR
jgi:hypothetical protein